MVMIAAASAGKRQEANERGNDQPRSQQHQHELPVRQQTGRLGIERQPYREGRARSQCARHQ